jgi:SAM-dependent methyltransferase
MGNAQPFDAVARRYDRLYSDPACRAEDAALLRLLDRLLPGHCDAVLDVGAGTGWLADRRGYAFREYWALDISSEMLAVLASKHPDAKCVQADMAATWPVPDAHFDAVLSLWCSASYCGPEQAAYEAVRCLRPGGVAVLMPHAPGAANPDGDGVRGDSYLPRECYNGTTGWRPWSPGDVRRALSRTGVRAKVEGFAASPAPKQLGERAHGIARSVRQALVPDRGCEFLVVTITKES